jgi:hypothetical protein
MKDFINYDSMLEVCMNLFTEVVEEFGYDKDLWDEEITTYADICAQDAVDSMRKYVHKKDTRMCGNFCNIREDWEYCPEFIGSDVKPLGRFDDVIKSIDDETISDEDLAKFQTWTMDWYFTAFGTFGLKYNFGEIISEKAYEMEMEDAA